MSDLNELRVGNFVRHRGGIGDHDFAEIIEVEDSDPKMYHLQHRRQPEGFVGYDDQLGGIIIHPEHLEALGFLRNPRSGFFEFYHHIIAYEAYTTTGEDGQPVNVFPIMRIFKPFAMVPQDRNTTLDPKEFENRTIPLLYVHLLQNYFTDRGLTIDFTPLRAFQNPY